MEQYITCREVAARYGVKIGTVWEWVRTGRLAANKFDRFYRITQGQIEAFERQRAQKRGK
jgi:excisionase family DNA binding protein